MKGFIEVTDFVFDKKRSININLISKFYKNDKSTSIIIIDKLTSVKESYEEVKELIRKAQNDCQTETIIHRIEVEPIDKATLKALKAYKAAKKK